MGAFHAHFGQARLDELALHALDLAFEGRALRRLTASDQVPLGLVQEAALPEGVAGSVTSLLDHVEALGNLSVGIPVSAFQLPCPREWMLARIELLDEAGARPRHISGAGVEERNVAQVPRQRDQILHAEGVHLQRVVEGRVEVDDAGRVHHGIHGPAQLLAQTRFETAERVDHVARDGRHLLANEGLEPTGVLRAQRVETLVGHDLRGESLGGALCAPRPHHQPDVLDLRPVVEQVRPPDLAQKAGTSDHYQTPAREQAREVQRRSATVGGFGSFSGCHGRGAARSGTKGYFGHPCPRGRQGWGDAVGRPACVSLAAAPGIYHVWPGSSCT